MCSSEEEIVKNLTTAIDLSLSLNCSNAERQKAYKFCEDFKENYPKSSDIAFLLTSNQYQDIHRHFGCQLIEHVVKFKWNDLSIVDKVGIKDKTICLVLQGLKNFNDEKDHIKDAISRVIVEIIKREWPQQWPSLMDELNSLLNAGPVQAQIVLLVFLRLAEDVVTLQTVHSQRRKDILSGLNSEMKNIFQYMSSTLQNYIEILNQSPENSEMAHMNMMVAKTTLSALTGYVDWVPIEVLTLKDNLLLKLLISLFKSELKVKSAEIFLLITSRKGKLSDKEPLLCLLSQDYLVNIIQTIMSIASECNFDDFYYMKVLCQSLTAIGIILLFSWKKEFYQTYLIKDYLDCMLAFTSHQSQALSSLTVPFWNTLLKDENTREMMEQIFQGFIHALFSKLQKVDNDQNPYSAFDFDNEVEYLHFFSKFRNDITELIRLCALYWPKIMFGIVDEILTGRMSQTINYSNVDQVNVASMQWDTTSSFVDAVCSRLTQSNEIDINRVLDLFKRMLAFNVMEANILSSLLSCISAFIPYLQYCSGIVMPLLDKTFSAAVYKVDGQTKSNRSKSVKNVRRHACSLVVKMCKQSPQMFLPHFNHLYDHVKRVCSDPEELSKMEKCALTEAMLLLSNGFESYEKQYQLIGEILTPIQEFWTSTDFRELVFNPNKFMNAIGLSQPAVDPSREDICGILRSQIIHGLFTIYAVVKRVTVPNDNDIAVKCGYGVFLNGRQYFQNPAFDHIKPLLENVVGLQKTYYHLWESDCSKNIHEDFSGVFQPSESDKMNIFGRHICTTANDNSNEKNPQDRMQNFLRTIHDYSNHILGQCGKCFGYNMYGIQGLPEVLISSILPGLNLVTDYHIRNVIRTFLKPYFLNCPKEFWSENIIHMLTKFSPFMYNRLEARWQRIDDYKDATEYEAQAESQEILEDQLLRLLTREYLDLLVALCFSKKLVANTELDNTDAMIDGETPVIPSSNNDLNECGQAICSKEDLFQCLVVTIFTMMVKNDSSTCAKCVNLAQSFVRQIFVNNPYLLSNESVCSMFKCILNALHVQSKNDGITASLIMLAMHFYNIMRPHHPHLMEIMKQVPDISIESLNKYEKQIMTSSLSDKKKKNTFKSLINGAIGHHISEEYKLKIRIEDLPRLVSKNMKVSNIDEDAAIGICSLFSDK